MKGEEGERREKREREYRYIDRKDVHGITMALLYL